MNAAGILGVIQRRMSKDPTISFIPQLQALLAAIGAWFFGPATKVHIKKKVPKREKQESPGWTS